MVVAMHAAGRTYQAPVSSPQMGATMPYDMARAAQGAYTNDEKKNMIMRPVHDHPFKQTGNSNRKYKNLFSTYDHTDVRKKQPQVGGNGCPSTTHRGLTSVRQVSLPGRPGPTAAAKPKKRPPYEWMACPFVQKSLTDTYRTARPRNTMGRKSFKFGSGTTGKLFDPEVRLVGLRQEGGKGRKATKSASLPTPMSTRMVSHGRRFMCSTSPATQHMPMCRKKEYQYEGEPYIETEKPRTRMTVQDIAGYGMRPQCNTIHDWQPAIRIPKTLGGETDRNPRLHAIEGVGEICVHNCACNCPEHHF